VLPNLPKKKLATNHVTEASDKAFLNSSSSWLEGANE